MAGATDMPVNRAGDQPPPEELGSATPAEGKGGQDQDYPETRREKTFLGNAKDAMDELDLLDRLPAR